MLPRPVQVSWGLEQRYEHFRIEPGDEASYIVGDYVIPAGQPFAGLRPNPGLASYAGTAPEDSGSVSRNVYAAYVDVGTNLTETWYVGVAGRHERYTGDVGDTTSGKLTTRWEFLPGYAVRGTISNGFRAPSLAQQVFASSTINGSLCAAAPNNVFRGVPCVPGEYLTFPTKVLRVDTSEAKALGATPLKPETSTNYSVGITAEPTSRLRITLDAYQIDIDDRIVDTSNLDLSAAQLASQPDLAPLLARFPAGLAATYYTNAVSTRTTGVDLVAEYAFDLGEAGAAEPQRRLRLQQDQDHQADRHPGGAQGGQSEPGAVRSPEDRRPDRRHAAQEADPRRDLEPRHRLGQSADHALRRVHRGRDVGQPGPDLQRQVGDRPRHRLGCAADHQHRDRGQQPVRRASRQDRHHQRRHRHEPVRHLLALRHHRRLLLRPPDPTLLREGAMQRRSLIAALTAAVLLAGCGAGSGDGPAALKVGSQRGGTKAILIASGALEGVPYKIEWSEFAAAQPLLEAVGAGAVDLGEAGDAPFLFAYASGAKIKAVQAGKSGGSATALLVRKGAPIHGVADLRGKKIATGRGSIGHYLLLRLLEEAGLKPTDVQIVFLNPGDAKAAFTSGAIDGWVTWGSYVALAKLHDDAVILADGEGRLSGYGFEAASEAAIAGKRPQVEDFCAAWPRPGAGRASIPRNTRRPCRRRRACSRTWRSTPSSSTASRRRRSTTPPWRRRRRCSTGSGRPAR